MRFNTVVLTFGLTVGLAVGGGGILSSIGFNSNVARAADSMGEEIGNGEVNWCGILQAHRLENGDVKISSSRGSNLNDGSCSYLKMGNLQLPLTVDNATRDAYFLIPHKSVKKGNCPTSVTFEDRFNNLQGSIQLAKGWCNIKANTLAYYMISRTSNGKELCTAHSIVGKIGEVDFSKCAPLKEVLPKLEGATVTGTSISYIQANDGTCNGHINYVETQTNGHKFPVSPVQCR